MGGYLEQRFRRLGGKFDFLNMVGKVARHNKSVSYGTFAQEVHIDTALLSHNVFRQQCGKTIRLHELRFTCLVIGAYGSHIAFRRRFVPYTDARMEHKPARTRQPGVQCCKSSLVSVPFHHKVKSGKHFSQFHRPVEFSRIASVG